MRANRFIYILNGDRVPLEGTRSDGTAVKHHTGNVEVRNGHHSTGNGLVAPHENNKRVKQIAARDQFDRVGDHFATNQRGFHTLGAHGDAIGNRNRVEFQRSAAGFADAGFHVFGKFAQMVVARADFDPRVRYADQWLFEVIVVQPGSAQHGTCSSAVGTADEGLAAKFWKWIGHVTFLSKYHPPGGLLHSGDKSRRKSEKAITLVWMMARISRKSSLRHHPVLPLI